MLSGWTYRTEGRRLVREAESYLARIDVAAAVLVGQVESFLVQQCSGEQQ